VVLNGLVQMKKNQICAVKMLKNAIFSSKRSTRLHRSSEFSGIEYSTRDLLCDVNYFA